MNLKHLEPACLWREFFALCAIPHPSHQEEALGEWVVGRARSLGLSAHKDACGNVYLKKPAQPGLEGKPGVILQAHLDMVPQVAAGHDHDFSRDPIRPRLDGADPDWLIATGTTLGADNGIGVAAALALLADDRLRHGPLEALFTVNEEDGMTGARAVEQGHLAGSLLLNLDGEDDTELTIGCAGTLRTKAEFSFPGTPPSADERAIELRVGGLLGGHSGVDIDKGRGNASLLLARVLAKATEASPSGSRLAFMEGGTAANAIPREARALVLVADRDATAFRTALEAEGRRIADELKASDPGFALGVTDAPLPALAVSASASLNFLATLLALPNGLFEMDPDMPGLVRSSSNLGELRLGTKDAAMVGHTLALVRSSIEETKERYGSEIERLLADLGARQGKVRQTRPAVSPAWTPNLQSPLLATAVALYRDLRGNEPKIGATHGGLETGLFRPRFPHWDMISVGPCIKFPHSPDERVSVSSTARFYAYVRSLIERLAG